ncbi:hypothetical protein NCAS_0B01010 [Naumovozyma castellii]|uniref:CUE domain-containing protein n=1 Tax=Naumovozyma castellii TaxID=27288 RepID=G0VB61_NAUCA|nr:hypothetical protein NCAS_0B01010 [Naumovozyma castellii CBS 4309]CCC68185.1 hypothetical protein NCAS_0B01010 [Naumovozyma castellii CBS 4309]
MDTSTVLFFTSVILGFLALKWFTKNSQNYQNLNTEAAGGDSITMTHVTETITIEGKKNDEEPKAADDKVKTKDGRKKPIKKRIVTRDMIEVVMIIAPSLTEQQIRTDLEKTGSIEKTVENFLRGDKFTESQEDEDQKKSSQIQQEEDESEDLSSSSSSSSEDSDDDDGEGDGEGDDDGF